MISEIHLLQREAAFLEEGEESFRKLLQRIEAQDNAGNKSQGQNNLNEASMESEIQELTKRLNAARKRRHDAQHRRAILAKDIHLAGQLRDTITKRANQLSYEYSCLQEHVNSMTVEASRSSNQLKKFMQINVINDAFFIWYSGPFATINNFRLGNIPSRPVEWTEINAALGQAVLAVTIVAAKAGIEFKRYYLSPMGSFSKVYKVDDRRNPYSLFTDGSFSLFPKRNFNTALQGFLYCVQELGEYVGRHDPTLTLPYKIYASDIRIHDQTATLGSDDEVWTRSLKFLLADIKWLIAWSTKHSTR